MRRQHLKYGTRVSLVVAGIGFSFHAHWDSAMLSFVWRQKVWTLFLPRLPE